MAVVDMLASLPIPPVLADAAHSMAPAYLRRRLTRRATPHIEGDTATFVYVGDATAVTVKHFMSCFPQIPPMERLSGTDLWYVTVVLPHASRIEYQLEVVTAERTVQINDPLNRRTARDPFGSNSVAYGPGYVNPPWCSPGVDAAKGRLEAIDVESEAFGGVRRTLVYLPAGFPGLEPYPAVVLHDGSDLVDFASLTTVLDNLIGAGAVAPLVGLLIDPVDRNREFMALPQHGRFVVDELLPHAIAEFAVSTHPRDRIIGGASLGAVASLATAWRHPGTFGSLMLMSGTFITATGGPWNRSESLRPVIDFVAEFEAQPGHPAERAWVSCGAFEALAEDNRAFVPSLERAGLEVTYRETPDGHHWQNWRNNIGEALRTLLPGTNSG